MNKTVTINIGGLVFHIEEDAFDKLSNYLKSIRNTFNNSDGKDEIMADIEARIAELLKEKLGTYRQVVLISDVSEVINIMGKPEDYSEGTTSEEKSHSEKDETNSNNTRHRVFRDQDEKVLGGVCSGISYYFGIDPIWLRIGFAIAFFCFGTGLILYIILCLVIPKAKTTAEKLEMRGEKINVDNIKKSIYEDLEDVKKKANELKNDAKEWGKNGKTNARDFGDSLGNFITTVVGGIIRVVGKIIAVIFIFIGIALIIGLLGSVLGLGNIVHMNHTVNDITTTTSFSLLDFLNVVFDGSEQITLVIIGILLTVLIPLSMLIYKGIRILFSIPRKSKIINGTAAVLFTSGILILIWVGYKVSKNFAEEANHKETITLKPFACDTLFIKSINETKYDFDNQEGYDTHITVGSWNLVNINDKKINFGYPKLDIVQNDIDSFQVVLMRSARGLTKKNAVSRAKNIEYDFMQNDSVIEFDSFYEILKDDKWRNQDLTIILKVPLNKVIYLSKSTANILFDVENVTDTYDRKMVSRRWLMGPNGLECLDCDGLKLKKKKYHSIEESIDNSLDKIDESLDKAEKKLNTY
jgi:phage shock protein PspC (stress-responsive transcriptional regulator)